VQELVATLLEYLALKCTLIVKAPLGSLRLNISRLFVPAVKNRVLIRDAGGIPALVDTIKSRMHLPNKLPFLEAIRNVCDESGPSPVSEHIVGLFRCLNIFCHRREQSSRS
jgi:hypothetical protein